MQLDAIQLIEILLEFLEAFVHQVLFLREVYSPLAFERQRLYGIAIKRSRHPELNEYIKDAVAGLKVRCRSLALLCIPRRRLTPPPALPALPQAAVTQGTLAKVAVVVLSPSRQALERFIVEATLSAHVPLPPPGAATAATLPPPPDILEVEAQLRAALLKLQYSSALFPRPPPGSSFEIVAYVAGRGSVPAEAWTEEALLSSGGLELEAGAVVPVQSIELEGAFRLQCYAEVPAARPGGGAED